MILAESLWTPGLDEFRAFAALSGDDNPIHLEAGDHRFGRPVAHGMLIHARLVALAHGAGVAVPPDAALIFPNPAFAGEPLRLRLRRDGASAERLDGTPVCRLHWPDPPRASLTRSFTAEDLAGFAALTGHPEGDTVPEPLVAALFSCLLGTRLPGPGTGWLKQALRHHAPARVGEALTATVQLARLRRDKGLADLDCTCTGAGGRSICHGRALMLLPPGHTLLSCGALNSPA